MKVALVIPCTQYAHTLLYSFMLITLFCTNAFFLPSLTKSLPLWINLSLLCLLSLPTFFYLLIPTISVSLLHSWLSFISFTCIFFFNSFSSSSSSSFSSLLAIEVSISRRGRGVTRRPKTSPTLLPSAPNGSNQRAEWWRDPGEGGEGAGDLEERGRGSRDHGKRKGTITGEGRITRSSRWPAGGRAGSGGGAAAVSDSTCTRICHSHTHHTSSGN